MNWKNRLKNYNFWISIFSAVLLILQALKIKFDVAYVNEIFTAVLGLLVVIGIISDPTKTTVKAQEVTENKVKDQAKTEDKTKEENKEIKTNAQILPIVAKDETNSINLQNDFQTIVATIKDELNKAMEEIKNIKETNINRVVENQIDVAEKIGQTPVVAEMPNDNPYIDVIN